MTAVAAEPDPFLSGLNEQVADVLGVLARQQLLHAPPLPPAAAAAVRAVRPANAEASVTLRSLADLRDGLARAAAGTAVPPGSDAAEPSLAALASLVEQQAFTTVAARALALHQAGDAGETAKYVTAAGPVVRTHPWGPYVQSLGVDASADAKAVKDDVGRVSAGAVGPWAARAADAEAGPDDLVKDVAARWRRPAYVLSDAVTDDYAPEMATEQAARCCGGDRAGYLRRLRAVDPHSAVVAGAWMEAVGPDRAAALTDAGFGAAVGRVEAEFTDRPGVVDRAAEWCQAPRPGRPRAGPAAGDGRDRPDRRPVRAAGPGGPGRPGTPTPPWRTATGAAGWRPAGRTTPTAAGPTGRSTWRSWRRRS